MMKERMGRAALVLCVAFAAAAGSSSCKSSEDKGAAAGVKSGAPKIVAIEAAFDFGKVKQGQVVEHVFKIKNEGAAELKIEKAHGS